MEFTESTHKEVTYFGVDYELKGKNINHRQVDCALARKYNGQWKIQYQIVLIMFFFFVLIQCI